MATFYVLPPRTVLGNQLARMMQTFLPGLKLLAEACLELLQSTVEGTQQEIYLVHREDLPEVDDLTAVLCDAFGAESGDRIVQVSLGPIENQPKVRSWHVDEADTPVRVASFI